MAGVKSTLTGMATRLPVDTGGGSKTYTDPQASRPFKRAEARQFLMGHSALRPERPRYYHPEPARAVKSHPEVPQIGPATV